MKIEKIRKSHNKELIIGGLIIGIVGIATLSLTRAKYQNIEDIKLVEGTINYKPYDFKMIAMYKSDDGTNYTEITDRMPDSGYVINEEKSYCTTDGVNKDTNAKLYTSNSEHIFKNLIKSDKCYVYFDNAFTAKSVSELANKLSKIAKLEAPDFSAVATTDKGIYATLDFTSWGDLSYYWRGAATTNYVKFAGYCWRIVRINADGTMRLIYDGYSCHANGTSTTDSIVTATSTKYNTLANRSEYVGWTYTEGLRVPEDNNQATSSNAKTILETWYSNNIGKNSTYASKVADGKYCNNRCVSLYEWASQPTSTFYYMSRIKPDLWSPQLRCNKEEIYTLKVGLITVEEVMLAGGGFTNNTSYYLYNGNWFWTMSPSNWDASASRVSVLVVNTSGAISSVYVNGGSGIRPVINLRSDTQISAGIGTLDNPYIIN